MADVGALELIRGLYDYHWWANDRLLEVAVGLGQEMADREIGRQFSEPTLTRMFVHLYGADAIWLGRWEGVPPTTPPGRDIRTLAALRPRWDDLRGRQRSFLAALAPEGLGRVIELHREGTVSRQPLWALLQHVPNHATHHRSEIATMLTVLSGSPPDTGMVTYRVERRESGR